MAAPQVRRGFGTGLAEGLAAAARRAAVRRHSFAEK
jgi:hypothetical protein